MPGDANQRLPHVVVLGAGFGGLNFCLHFEGKARVTVVDKQNHHLFQPLLYQVAMAGLSAPEIAAPIRHVLHKKANLRVLMDEVMGIDVDRKCVRLQEEGDLEYDYLVFALGGVTSYFGHPEWAQHALGLKTLDDAVGIRWRILRSFEKAETEEDAEKRRRLMTIIICGAGPTGVELAGACSELTRRVFRRDFRNIDTAQARIVLIEATPRVLPMYPEKLSEKAERQLEELGVEVVKEAPVEDVQPCKVTAGGRVFEAENILWGAGVVASPLVKELHAEQAKGGRVKVAPDLSLPGHPEVFVVGDAAWSEKPDGSPTPAIAPVAIQMGKHVANVIEQDIERGPLPADQRSRFEYRDRGVMSTIGRSRAVAWLFNRYQLSGLPAWIAWLVVHLFFLIGFRNRLAVLLQWFYAYVTYQRGARIIYGATRAAATQREQEVSAGRGG